MAELTTIAPLLLAAAILVPAVIIDVATHRIPNLLNLAGLLSGLAMHAWLGGWGGLGSAFVAGLLLLLATFPFFAIGWLGAGDVKLIAAVGVVAGSLPSALAVLVMSVTAGAFMGLLVLYRRRALGVFRDRMESLAFLSRPALNTGTCALVLPYSIAIAIGGLIVMTFQALTA